MHPTLQPQPQLEHRHGHSRLAWTVPVWKQYVSQCQFNEECERACLRDATACYVMCDYNTQCANACNERLLQCATMQAERERERARTRQRQH